MSDKRYVITRIFKDVDGTAEVVTFPTGCCEVAEAQHYCSEDVLEIVEEFTAPIKWGKPCKGKLIGKAEAFGIEMAYIISEVSFA